MVKVRKKSDSGKNEYGSFVKDASELRNANYPWHWKQYFDLLGIDTTK